MSGPKTSNYRLTPEQRRILQEARIRERKIQAERSRISQAVKIIMQTVVSVQSEVSDAQTMVLASGTSFAALSELLARQNEAMQTANAVAALSDSSDPELLQREREKIIRQQKELQEKTNLFKAEFDGVEQSFQADLQNSIAEGFELSFSAVGEQPKAPEENEPAGKIRKIIKSLQGKAMTPELADKLARIREKTGQIDSIEFLNNYYAVTVIPFLKEYECYERDYALYGERFEELLTRYELLADELGMEAVRFGFSAGAVAELEEVVAQWEELCMLREEQEYISRCVDEAMAEMGYSLMGRSSSRKKNGKRLKKELYLFDEGTAVNITTSDNGQIIMELGGLDDRDRVPTVAESRQLCQEMDSFCDDYDQIEQYLRKKGIETRKISVLPPGEQYAQIINTGDYELTGAAFDYEMRKKKRRGSAAALYHEGQEI